MTKVILVGCNGRMGQMITGLAAEDEEIEIIAGVDIADNRINSYPVFTDIKDCEAKADAIIDFSSSKGRRRVSGHADLHYLDVWADRTRLQTVSRIFYSAFPWLYARGQR